MIHSFNVEVAKMYSLSEAVFLYNLCFWQQKNIANDKHFYDGRHWSYNSMSAFQKLFPYLSLKQIRTVIDKLIEKGTLLDGNYNKLRMDRTKWYSVSDEVMSLHGLSDHLPIQAEHLPIQALPFAQEGRPIPYTNPIINTDKKNTSKSSAEVKVKPKSNIKEEIDNVFPFDQFWDRYGKKTGVTTCRKKFYALQVADIKKIKDTLSKYISDTPDPKFRKNPQTYLNQRVWDDYTVSSTNTSKSGDHSLNPAETSLVESCIDNGNISVLPKGLIHRYTNCKDDVEVVNNSMKEGFEGSVIDYLCDLKERYATEEM